MVFCALVVGKGFSVLFSWPDRLCLQPLQSFLGPHLYPLLIFLSCYLPIIIFLTASSLSPGSPPHPYPNFIFFNLVGKFISIFPRYPQSLFQTHHFLHSSILPSNIFFLKSNFDTRACTKAWQSLSYLFSCKSFIFFAFTLLSFYHFSSSSQLSLYPFFLWEVHPPPLTVNFPPLLSFYLFQIKPAFLSSFESCIPPLAGQTSFHPPFIFLSFLFILSSFERCTHHHSHHCQLFQTSILLLSLFIGSYFLISAVNVFLSLIIWKPLHTLKWW